MSFFCSCAMSLRYASSPPATCNPIGNAWYHTAVMLQVLSYWCFVTTDQPLKCCKCRMTMCGLWTAGITCLFASTHSNPDQNTAKYAQAQQLATASDEADQTPTEVQLLATAEADAAVHAEVPSGPSVELAPKMPNGSAGPAANNPGQSVDGNLSGYCIASVQIPGHPSGHCIARNTITACSGPILLRPKYLMMLMSVLCMQRMSNLRLA